MPDETRAVVPSEAPSGWLLLRAALITVGERPGSSRERGRYFLGPIREGYTEEDECGSACLPPKVAPGEASKRLFDPPLFALCSLPFFAEFLFERLAFVL